MTEIKDLLHVSDYSIPFGAENLHPLINVIDLSVLHYQPDTRAKAVRFGFYAIFLKQGQSCTLKYGRKNYDFQEGTMVFIAPRQVIDISSDGPDYQPNGLALLIHPDFLLGTDLGRKMDSYHYFSYDVSEALHMSEREKSIIKDCYEKIHFELSQGLDKHTKTLVCSTLELMFNYCDRFYDRQFTTRDSTGRGLVAEFERSIRAYFDDQTQIEKGLPTVAYFADQFHFSANYFGDLIKKETGIAASEHIQQILLEKAKQKLYDPSKSISEVANELGFAHPQHFSRLFKNKVGSSPGEFRNLN